MSDRLSPEAEALIRTHSKACGYTPDGIRDFVQKVRELDGAATSQAGKLSQPQSMQTPEQDDKLSPQVEALIEEIMPAFYRTPTLREALREFARKVIDWAAPLVCPTCHGEGEGCQDAYHTSQCGSALESAREEIAWLKIELKAQIVALNDEAEQRQAAEAALEAWIKAPSAEMSWRGGLVPINSEGMRRVIDAHAQAEAEVARLRDIPGDAAAYEEGMAALQAQLAEARATKDMHKERQEEEIGLRLKAEADLAACRKRRDAWKLAATLHRGRRHFLKDQTLALRAEVEKLKEELKRGQ